VREKVKNSANSEADETEEDDDTKPAEKAGLPTVDMVVALLSLRSLMDAPGYRLSE
jgi:hypothetical protein